MSDFKHNISIGQRLEYGSYQMVNRFLGKHGFVYKSLATRRDNFYTNLQEKLRESGEGRAIPIECIKDLTVKEFKNHYRNHGIPVVLKGAALHWDCVKKWSFEYFKQLHGDDEIVMIDKSKEKGYSAKTLTEVIDSIGKEEQDYYKFYPLLNRHPEHIHDIDYKWMQQLRNKRPLIKSFEVYLGGKDTETTMHNENVCNLFVQVHGKKKWILYPSYYSMVMDPEPVRSVYRMPNIKSEHNSFNPFAPDYDAYPGYQYIDHYETELEPGDILWNPPYYWHAVKNITNSIGIGYKWLQPALNFRLQPLYMFLDLFTSQPPLWKAIKLFNEDFNLLQLAEIGALDKYLKEKTERENNLKSKPSTV
jgi:hypothetical protein